MLLSIIIVNYKTKNLVKYCLRGIFELGMRFEHEIIVVDNNSDDGIEQLLKEEFPSVKFIKSDHNRGLAYGNNLGINASKGEYILILNPDIVVLKGSVEKMIAYLQANPRIGIIGPKLINPDKTVQESCFRYFKTYTPFYRRTFLGNFKFAEKELNRFLMRDFSHQENKEVDWVLGGAMMIRKSCLDTVGLFDENFFLYFEDVDLCRRFHLNNFGVHYMADAAMIHYHMRESLGSPLSRTTRAHISSWIKYFLKYKLKYR